MIYICSLEPNRYENVHGTLKTCTRKKTLERSKAPILHKMRAKHELVGLKTLYKCRTFMYPTKTRRLEHENYLFQITIKEGIFKIKLTNRPSKGDCKGKYQSNSTWFNYWVEGIKIINPRCLGKTLSHQTGLESVQRTILLIFCCVHPMTSNKSSINGW